jgi:hypothetical protein
MDHGSWIMDHGRGQKGGLESKDGVEDVGLLGLSDCRT